MYRVLAVLTVMKRSGFALFALLMVFLCSHQNVQASYLDNFSLDDKIVSHKYSGIALYGYDPVSYFMPTGLELGKSEIEAQWSGRVWRFTSKANRAEFLAHPERYVPQNGGYDPILVQKGLQVEGRPHLFLITDKGLFLFRNVETFEAFQHHKG